MQPPRNWNLKVPGYTWEREYPSEKNNVGPTMAPVKFKCKNPACQEWTEEAEPYIAIELIKLHTSQVHGVASKPE
jgi:hypothetical protein